MKTKEQSPSPMRAHSQHIKAPVSSIGDRGIYFPANEVLYYPSPERGIYNYMPDLSCLSSLRRFVTVERIP